MNNFGTWVPCAMLALYLGKEFLDWFWWYRWEDDKEDEPNPASLLCSSWPAWLKLDDIPSWLWSRLWWPVRNWLENTFPRLFPREEQILPMDKDGRNAIEWLGIAVIGVWNLEWYDGEYDKQIKQKWDEYMAESHAAETDGDAPVEEPENPD